MRQKLDYLCRLLATGYCFVFFILGGFLITVTLLPIARLSGHSLEEKNQRARRLVRTIWRFFVAQMQFLGLISVQVEGAELLQKASKKLVIANHPSLIDVILLYTLLPDTCMVVKSELWKHPMLGGVVRALGCVSNASAEELLGGCGREVQSGSTILLFPEGTRTKDNNSLKFQRGAANIAVRCGVDVVPVFIVCEPPTLRKGDSWYQIPERKVRFHLYAQPDIVVSDVVDKSQSPAKSTRELNRFFENYFVEGLVKYAKS